MKHLVVTAALAAALGAAGAQTPPAARGELLYENHCSACHGTQMHWREQRAVTDWASLRAMVRRWQGVAQLNWSDDEIDDVAMYLNGRFYRYDVPGRRVSLRR